LNLLPPEAVPPPHPAHHRAISLIRDD